MKLCKVLFASLLLCSLPIISLADDGCPKHATRKHVAKLENMEDALMLNLISLIHKEVLSGRMFKLEPSTHKVITDKTTQKIFGKSYTVTTFTALYGGRGDPKELETRYKEQLAKNEIEFPARNKLYGFKISASQIIIRVSNDDKVLHRAVLIPSEVCFWEKSSAEYMI